MCAVGAVVIVNIGRRRRRQHRRISRCQRLCRSRRRPRHHNRHRSRRRRRRRRHRSRCSRRCMQVMRTDVLSRRRRLSTSVRIAEYTDDDDDDTDGSGARVLAASAAAASARAPRVLAASAAAASAASVAASKHLIDPPVPRTAGRQCVRFTLTHMHPPSRYITPFTHMPPSWRNCA